MEALRKHFYKELTSYRTELQKSNLRADQKRAQTLISKFNPDYQDKLLFLYLERCKFVHALAFLQFRRILPNA